MTFVVDVVGSFSANALYERVIVDDVIRKRTMNEDVEQYKVQNNENPVAAGLFMISFALRR